MYRQCHIQIAHLDKTELSVSVRLPEMTISDEAIELKHSLDVSPHKKSNYGFLRNQWKTVAIKAVLYLQTELQLTSIRNFQLSKKRILNQEEVSTHLRKASSKNWRAFSQELHTSASAACEKLNNWVRKVWGMQH